MNSRAKWTGGLLGFALTLNCALAQTATAPSPTPAPVAAPQPAVPTPTPTAASVPLPAPVAPVTPTPVATPSPAVSPTATPIPVDIPVAAPPKPKKKAPLPPPPLETALSTDPNPTFQPNTFFATAKAAERYGAIVQAGGWPTDVVALHPGSKGAAVAELRKRLSVEGDLDATQPLTPLWDKTLTEAVKQFQSRMGLRQTGTVAGATLKAINVPAETRHNQLVVSSQRIANSSFAFGDRYVVVNLPSTSVEAIENGKIAHRYVAIVGDPEHPSPEISAHISVINLNPTWTLPTSIIKKEIIPKMQKDPGYLTRAKIRILDGSGKEIDPRTIDWSTNRAVNYTLRQDSGAGNSLGSIRIGMPNKLAVYMHDTPSKRLFGADYRFLSHGCVRVQGVYDYAEWLLEGTPGGPLGVWDKSSLLAESKSAAREDIKLTKPVPVIWVYLTGWANQDGIANFRNDVYGVDVAADANANADPSAQPVPAAVNQ